MKILFFDLETTGVMHWKNGIHQIAGYIEVDGEVVEKFDYKVRPNPKAIIDPTALEVAGVTLEQVMDYPDMSTIFKSILKMLAKYVNKYDKKEKFHLCGYNNASFDNAFLRAFFVQNGDNYFGSWFWSSTIDVMVLAADHLMNVRHEMQDFKLKTVAAQLGIEVDESKLHDGMYDIELTRGIYNIIKNHKHA